MLLSQPPESCLISLESVSDCLNPTSQVVVKFSATAQAFIGFLSLGTRHLNSRQAWMDVATAKLDCLCKSYGKRAYLLVSVELDNEQAGDCAYMIAKLHHHASMSDQDTLATVLVTPPLMSRKEGLGATIVSVARAEKIKQEACGFSDAILTSSCIVSKLQGQLQARGRLEDARAEMRR